MLTLHKGEDSELMASNVSGVVALRGKDAVVQRSNWLDGIN
jgi:hypothetical protein